MQNVSSEQPVAEKKNVAYSRFKRRFLKHIWLARVALLTSFILIIYLVVTLLGFVLGKPPVGFYGAIAYDFLFTPKGKIESIEDRTNILILGKGGEGHEAPELTDTVIFTSINHRVSKVSLISLPRDIWVPSFRTKLNSIYYWGNQKQKGGGLILTKSIVEEIVGQPVHYGIVVDFEGFKKIIDEIGGVEVDVEKAFTDKRYPIPGREEDDCGGDDPEYLCRYETISFEEGKEIMNGETALKFVRSRNAEGDEGTDTARAARQQKILDATKNRVLSFKVLLSPKKMAAIVDVLRKYVETDVDPSTTAIMARLTIKAKDNIYSHVLSEDFLINPPLSSFYDNLYVFVPKDDTWAEVQEWTDCVLENGDCN